jgi:hypothetical protein
MVNAWNLCLTLKKYYELEEQEDQAKQVKEEK